MLDLHHTHTNISLERGHKRSDNKMLPSFILLLTVFAMILFGLTILYSTSSGIASGSRFFIKQGTWAVIGSIVAAIIYYIGYKKLSQGSLILVILAIAGLTAALFFPEINGARRWIRLPGMSLQPSELAKVALIIYLANYLPKRKRFVNTFEGGMPAFTFIVIIIALIMIGEDLGTTLLLLSAVSILFFIAGTRLRWLFAILSFPAMLLFLIKQFDPMRWGRMTSFLDPEAVNEAKGYQLWNSLLALGSGGWYGLGFTKSRMKAMYLPEAHTDFILSIVGEELGFIAIIGVILAYIVIMLCGIWISLNASDKTGMLIGIGVTSLITIQAVINLGVVSGAFPTKGMPAPFISYGGSNMLSSLCCVGLLLSINKKS